MRRVPLTVLVALALLPRSIAAHPINTALSVVSQDAIRIGHGLVTMDQQGRWRFVCPTTWGGPATPLSVALAPDTMLVIAAGGPFEMTLAGVASPLSARIDAMSTREVERAGEVALALANDGNGSVIEAFEVGSQRELLVSGAWLHSIEGTSDGFVVTSSAAEGALLTTHRLDGTELASQIIRYPDIRTATVGIERAGDELYALIAHPGEYRLARVEGDRFRLIASSPFPILGPVRAGDEVWFVEDDALLRINGSDIEVVDQSQLYSCLEEVDGMIRACIGTQIFTISPGAAPELFFDLAQVKGPRLSHLAPEDRVACEFEWNILAGEVGLDPTIPPDDEPPDPECGCTSAGSRGSVESVLLCLAFVCLRAWRQRSSRLVNLRRR